MTNVTLIIKTLIIGPYGTMLHTGQAGNFLQLSYCLLLLFLLPGFQLPDSGKSRVIDINVASWGLFPPSTEKVSASCLIWPEFSRHEDTDLKFA